MTLPMPLVLPPIRREHRLRAAVATVMVVSALYLLPMYVRLVEPTPLVPTVFDRAVPLLDWTIWIYFSYAVFLLLPFAVCRDGGQLARAFYRLMANSAVAGLIFLAWPTAGVVQQPTLEGVSGWLWSALLSVDRPTNYFPSLHVGNACVCAHALRHERGRWRIVAPAWATLIAVSTVTTKQHFVIDLAGGVALAVCSTWLVRRWVRVEGSRQGVAR